MHIAAMFLIRKDWEQRQCQSRVAGWINTVVTTEHFIGERSVWRCGVLIYSIYTVKGKSGTKESVRQHPVLHHLLTVI